MADLVAIATYDRVAEADVARLALQQAGITAHLEGANLVTANPLFSNAVGGIRLCVATEDAPAAQQVLHERGTLQPAYRENSEAPPASAPLLFACDECGHTVRFPAELAGRCEVCPHCGGLVDVPELEAVDNGNSRELSASETTTAEPGVVLPNDRAATPTPRPGGDWLEVLVVLCVAYLPSLYAAIESIMPTGETSTTARWYEPDYEYASDYDYNYLFIFSAINIVFVLHLTWRNGEHWSTIGVDRFRWFRDPALGIGCFAAQVLAQLVVWNLLSAPTSAFDFLVQSHRAVGFAATEPGDDFIQTLVYLIATVAAAYCEELVFRGYLLTRLIALLQSTWVAVFVSTVIFASFHIYQGAEGLLSSFTLGLVFAGMFLWLRRLWPLAIAHSIYNFWVLYT